MADRRSTFSIDVSAVLAASERLAKVDSLTQDSEMVQRLNELVDDVYETARGRMNAGINLTDAYLRARMNVIHATPQRGLSAEIVARGARSDQTPLGRYMSGQATVDAPRAKGDASRGISAGRKQAGVQVQVRRGAEKTITNGFTLPLRAGKELGGNGIGIFTRSRFGIVQHRYGPAVYQLFRVAAGELEDSVGDKLERLGIVAQDALEKAING